MTEDDPIALHGTALVFGEAGILIRGGSGTGKSSLALLLIDEARRSGRFARLVGDDRVLIRVRQGVAIAAPHPAIAGLLERRTQPFARVAHEARCVLRLVVDLHPPGSRLPRWLDDDAATTTVAGSVTLPQLSLQAPLDPLCCRSVLDKLAATRGQVPT